MVALIEQPSLLTDIKTDSKMKSILSHDSATTRDMKRSESKSIINLNIGNVMASREKELKTLSPKKRTSNKNSKAAYSFH